MIPIFRAKSNERKNTYVEGFLIGVDEELGLCTIRTKDDYIDGEICYLHTLSINFPDMLDGQGNKIFASLQKDGKGGDIVTILDTTFEVTYKYIKGKFLLDNNIDTFNPYVKFKIIGIQQ